MTKYFEVQRRDGPARIGKLMLEDPIQTPAILSSEDYISVGSVFDFGSVEEAMARAAFPDDNRLVIMPHVPSGLRSKPSVTIPEIEREGPKGVAIHPFFSDEPEKADLYAICSAGALKNPRELVRAVVGLRERTAPDSALYAPAIATAANLAFLIYLGIDAVDGTRVEADGYLGRYHTRDGVREIDDLEELPCTCDHCRAIARDEGDRMEQIAGHNLLKLGEELLAVREGIRSGRIREMIEGRVRVYPELTAGLRILDAEEKYIEARTPEHRSAVMYANTAESLNRADVRRFADRVQNRFTPPGADVLLLLPCSARKPYSTSRSHRLFIEALGSARRFTDELILTSPLALVPRELEEVYPAANYDVPVTGHWDLEERAWLLSCLDKYLEANRYSKIIAHIDGELREAVEEHGIEAVYTGGGTKDDDLDRLRDAVSGAVRGGRKKPDFRIQQYRAVADFYFGRGAGDALVGQNARIKGRELQGDGKRTLGSITPNGMIALTIAGAKRLETLGRYIVTIGDFLPRGSLLAPGVVDADPQIRPGDEVIIKGPKAFGVGRAKMSGWEMVRSSRGIAADIRKIEKA